jgi:hypothetical protein
LATLRAESESEIAELKADIEKLIVPRHFASLEELTAWLSQDDTDTNPTYATLGLAEQAFNPGGQSAAGWLSAAGQHRRRQPAYLIPGI